MIKTKKKNAQSPLIVTGYILFALLVIGVLLSTTIPFGRMLFNPNVLHYNVALFTIALTVGAILPATIGYIIGDRAVKSKNKTSHHFNGMLFGLLAYWVMMILTVLVSIPSEHFSSSPGAWALIVNVVPSIGVAFVTTILALNHVHGRQAKKDLIGYKPYRVAHIGAIVLVPVYSLASMMFAGDMNVSSFSSLGLLVFLGVISYVTLRKTKLDKASKLAWSAVSVSISFIMVYVSYQLVPTMVYYFETMPTMEFQTATSSIAWIVAIVGWVVYWSVQVKRLK